MNFWIFKFNPDKYRLQDRFDNPNPKTTWTVYRYRDQIIPGDTVFVWQTGQQRGVRAVLQVDSVPADMREIESEQQYWVDRDSEVRCRRSSSLSS